MSVTLCPWHVDLNLGKILVAWNVIAGICTSIAMLFGMVLHISKSMEDDILFGLPLFGDFKAMISLKCSMFQLSPKIKWVPNVCNKTLCAQMCLRSINEEKCYLDSGCANT